MMPSLFLLYVLPAVFYSLHCMQAFVPKLEVNVAASCVRGRMFALMLNIYCV